MDTFCWLHRVDGTIANHSSRSEQDALTWSSVVSIECRIFNFSWREVALGSVHPITPVNRTNTSTTLPVQQGSRSVWMGQSAAACRISTPHIIQPSDDTCVPQHQHGSTWYVLKWGTPERRWTGSTMCTSDPWVGQFLNDPPNVLLPPLTSAAGFKKVLKPTKIKQLCCRENYPANFSDIYINTVYKYIYIQYIYTSATLHILNTGLYTLILETTSM